MRKQHQVSLIGITIWILAAIFYFFDNLLNVSPAVMKPELSIAFNLTAAALGLLSSCYAWAYGLMQIPAGLLMDRFGPRKLLAGASLVCAMGAYIFAGASNLSTAQLGRIFIGVGSSFAVVGCSKVGSIWFSANKFAVLTGLMVAIGMLGAAFGLSTVNYILQFFNWRQAMYVSSIVAVILSILMWLIIKDHPSKKFAQEHHLEIDPASKISLWQGFKKIFKSTQVWAASIYAGLMFVPTLALGGLWGVPYLVEGHNLSRELAGILVSLIFVGWMFGGPIYGWISDYLRLRNLPMYVANVATLIITVILIFVPNISATVIAILMFLLGLFSSGFILAFAVTKESNDHRLSATAIGFINTINTFGGASVQWLIGKILDVITAKSILTSGEKIFSYSEYQMALTSIPICLVIALISLFMLKETHCKSINS